MPLSSFFATQTPTPFAVPIADGSGSLNAWVTSGSGGIVAADDVTYSNGSSGLAATNVQDAIDELALSAGSGSVDIQAALDSISNVHGSILFRGASAWQALAPGVAGEFLMTNGSGADPTWGTSIVYDTDAQNYFDEIAAAGGSIGLTAKSAINNFVIGCKADSIWSLMLDIGPLCGNGLAAALVKLKKLSSGWSYTNHNFVSGDYSQSTGLTGGATKYLSSGVTASSLTAGSTGLGIYDRSNVSSVNNQFGVTAGSDTFTFYAPYPDNFLYSDMYNSATELASGSAISGATGFLFAVRSAGPLHKIYRNGSSVASTSTVGGALPGADISFFGVNSSPTFLGHSLAFLCITAGMDATQEGLFYTRIQALQTALGRQV